jgi:mannobiose 2-epimerase
MLNKLEFKNHLVNDLLPFWNNLYDSEHGGFYGRVDSKNQIDKKSPKAGLLQPRILAFYSSCYTSRKDERAETASEQLLKFADLQFEFINQYMLDPDDGGIYWSVGHDGKIKDSSKHTYVLAFALYAISAYYSVSKSEPALKAADKLFDLLESKYKCKDDYGYIEPHIIDRHAHKHTRAMNTLLHVIEAYTEYYQAVKSEKARNALEYSINLVINKAYNDDLCRIECYFDDFMNPVGDMLSYGHDIEASWLVYRACEILGDDNITNNLAPKLEKVAQNVISKGFVNEGKSGIYYDCTDGFENRLRSWWVMSEAIVALVHRHNLYKNLYKDDKSIILAENIWNYVKTYFISPYGEWHQHLDDNNELIKPSDLCGAWKCPYHNGRMCLEMLNLLS